MDVYENEGSLFFRNMEDMPLESRMKAWDRCLAQLLSYPQVVLGRERAAQLACWRARGHPEAARLAPDAALYAARRPDRAARLPAGPAGRRARQVLITPHCAFLTHQALANIAATTVANVEEWLTRRGAQDGGAAPLTNAVRPPAPRTG